MKKTLFTTLLLTAGMARSQDALFTQLSPAAQYLNPAMASSDTMGRVDMAYRLQWPRTSNFSTFFAGYQQYISPINGHAAVHYLRDFGGPLNTQRYSLQYAQNIKLGKHFVLRPAFEATYVRKGNYRWKQVIAGDMVDIRTGFVYRGGNFLRDGNTEYFDWSAGLLTYWKKLYVALSAHHLTQPNESMVEGGHAPLPMKLGVQAGYTFGMAVSANTSAEITPYFNYLEQGSFNTYMGGINLRFNRHVIVGAGYRKADAVLMSAGYQNKYFRFIYSFDYTTSAHGIRSGGAHEISASVFFWRQKAHKKYLTTLLPTR